MNKRIRIYAKQKNVKLWEIAEKLGLQDSNFSKKLRHELSKQETDTIIAIIDEIANNNMKGGNNYE